MQSPSAGDSVELVATTYERLLDEVGGAKLTNSTITAMIDGGDPFKVPRGEHDLLSLQRRIEQFEKMVNEKHRDTGAVSSRLIQVLQLRLSRKERAREEQDTAVRKTWPDYDIPYRVKFDPPFEYHEAIAFSPDNRWVVLPDHPNDTSLSLFDTVTRTTRNYARPVHLGRYPYFLEGQAGLIFPYQGDTGAVQVPFSNGELSFAAAKELVPKDTGALGKLFPSSTPNVYFGPLGTLSAVRWDLSTGERGLVIAPIDTTGKIVFAAPVPHQQRYLFVDKIDEQFRLIVAAFDPDGKLTVENKNRKSTAPLGPIRFSADGNTLIASGEGLGTRVLVGPTLGDAALVPVTAANGTPEFSGRIIKVLPLPDSHDALVITEINGQQKSRVERVNLQWKRSEQSFDLPYVIRGNPILSSDGKVLILSGATVGQLRALNLGRYLGQ